MIVRRSPGLGLLGAFALGATLTTGACDRACAPSSPHTRDRAESPPRPAAADAFPAKTPFDAGTFIHDASLTRAELACEGGAVVAIDDSSMHVHVTEVSDLDIAAGETETVVTYAISGDVGCEQDGCSVLHEVHGAHVDLHDMRAEPLTVAWLGDARKRLPRRQTEQRGLPASTTGISPSADACAFVLDGRPFVLTQGHAGAAPMLAPGEEAADTMYVLGRDTAQRSVKWFSGRFAARGFGPVALALGTGVERVESPDLVGPPSVRLFRLRLDAPTVGQLVTKMDAPTGGAGSDLGGPQPGSFDAPSIDVSADRAAIAFRRHEPGAKGHSSAIVLAWVDRELAKLLSDLKTVARGDVGAPSVLVRGDTLHAVWSSRASAGGPYRLHHARWIAGGPAQEDPTELETGEGAALAPAIAAVGGAIALAWTSANGAVYAGLGESVEDAALHATQRSQDRAGASEPKWAVDGRRVLLAWIEGDNGHRIRLVSCF
jgi:hypothetical protein